MFASLIEIELWLFGNYRKPRYFKVLPYYVFYNKPFLVFVIEYPFVCRFEDQFYKFYYRYFVAKRLYKKVILNLDLLARITKTRYISDSVFIFLVQIFIHILIIFPPVILVRHSSDQKLFVLNCC